MNKKLLTNQIRESEQSCSTNEGTVLKLMLLSNNDLRFLLSTAFDLLNKVISLHLVVIARTS